jgi:hypothetical protein
VQGTGHRRNGQVCQDAHRWQVVEQDVLIAAVADGAGTAACAEIGAALAVQAGVLGAIGQLQAERPRSRLEWTILLQRAFAQARAVVIQNALDMELSPQEFSTTLLLAVAAPERLAVGQVGDGAVVARKRDGSFTAITRPAVQEYINETTFLTSPEYLDRAEWATSAEPITGLALLSDGLQMLALKMPHGAPHPAFFAPLLKQLESSPANGQAEVQLQKFLQSPPIAQRADDDLTLVLAVRAGGEE